MFNLFKKNKKPSYPSLFDKLPLSDEQQKTIEDRIKELLSQMIDEEKAEEAVKIQTEYPEQLIQYKRLQIDNMGWEEKDTEGQPIKVFVDEHTGNSMVLTQQFPSGQLKDIDLDQEFYLYQNNLRNALAQAGGGLISSELHDEDGLRAYVTIGKVPLPEGQKGMSYILILDVHNLEDNTLDQVQMRFNELGTTGLRDNLMVHPLMELFDIPMEGFSPEVYNQDPYEVDFREGNLRNFSELEQFDALFPFHPLSVLRQHILPRVLKSIQLMDEVVDEGGDIEVEFEEL
jgi:hypothetical protein